MGAFKILANNRIAGKKVVVTGGAGFIGSHLCEQLQLYRPERLFLIDDLSLGKTENNAGLNPGRTEMFQADLGDYTEAAQILDRVRPDVVFNLAVIPLPHSLEHPLENFDVNTRIVNNLCELQRLKVFHTLIHFSSSEAYGSAEYEPMDEKHPLGPSTPYAASKAAGDVLAMSYAKTFGLRTAILRPFNCYGPRQNEGSYAGVIPITINRILAGKEPLITGDGSQTRDYSFVQDVAAAAIALYQNIDRAAGRVVNMGSGRQTAISILVLLIQAIMEELGHPSPPARMAPPRPGDVRRHIANVYLAEDLLGYDPAMAEPLSSGLRQTIKWYLQKRKEKKR